MAEEKIPSQFNVEIYGDLVPYSSTISKARVRIFYRGLNRNWSYISDEFAEKLIKTLPYAPIKGIFSENEDDFTDHGTTNDLGKAYGVVPENGNGAWERHVDDDGIERTYYCTDVLLWTTLYETAKKIPGKSQSMELYTPSIKGQWRDFGVYRGFEFTDGVFLGLQVLGNEVEPCFEGAAFYNLQQQFSDIIEIAKNYNKKEEENKVDMEREEIEKVEETTDNQNQEVIENTNEQTQTEENFTEEQADENIETTVDETVETVSTENTTVIIENSNANVVEEQSGAEVTVENSFKAEYEQLKSDYEKLKEDFSKTSAEKIRLENEINHITIERDALKDFKLQIEEKEREAIIAKYSNVLSDEIIQKYNRENCSAIDLDKNLCYEVHKNETVEGITANYCYKNTENEEVTKFQSYLNNYKITD